MNEYKKSVAALIAAIAFGIFIVRANARVTTAVSTDRWSTGPSGSEVAVDVSGNLLPTTDANQTLGTAALNWKAVYSDNVVAQFVSPNRTSVSFLTLATSITPLSTTINLTTSAAAGSFPLAGTPTFSTATAVDGQFLIVGSTLPGAYKFILQDDLTLGSSALTLYAASPADPANVVISSRSAAMFYFNSADSRWHEVAR